MEIIKEILQGSPEWHELRKGRMTASHAQEIGVKGKGLETYCRKIAAQIYTGQISPDNYKNENMERGSEEERFARMAYELTLDVEVRQIAFAIYDEYAGASPDGLVGNDGGCEFKRKSFEKHNDLLLGATDFESKYIWQCHMNMFVLDRQWWDLCSYNPLVKNRCLYIKRIFRDKEKDKAIIEGLKKGKELILQYLENLSNEIRPLQEHRPGTVQEAV